jgi:phosphate starvation-inducible PhoH-like protein
VEAQQLLSKIEGLRFVYLSGKDIVRHPLVGKIVDAYEQNKIVEGAGDE